jgi:decaprenylphospho-beta-D-erythro-pentofuranosid-2-ulose 2-reductase
MRNAFGQPQTVLVLGGTSEIAHHVVLQLVRERTTTVVLAGRDKGRLEDAASELREAGATTVETITFDASDPSTAGATIDDAFHAAGGPIDLVLLAVGQLGDQDISDNDPVATIKLFDVNLTWPAAALAALRGRLISQGMGHVAVFSSVAGVRVRRANFTYGATKAGLDALAQGFGDSVRSSGIKVQIVRPGFVRTKMTQGLSEAPFTTDVDQAAETIVKGLSSSATAIWSPPVLQGVFFIMKNLPGFLWRRLPG